MNPPFPSSPRKLFWSGRLALVLLAIATVLVVLGFGGTRSEFWLGGIQVNEDDLSHWLDRLEATGMNTVSVTDYAKQGDWDSANLWFDGDMEGEVREIRAAKGRGLHVVLILRVALDHAFPRNKFLWHGMIQPRSDREVREWFQRYGSFAREWARVADREGVDALMIGSELNALTNTLPLEELPPLEDWYLDAEKRQEVKEHLLAHAEEIEGRHLSLPHQEGYDDLASYLEDQIAMERAWAETTAGRLEDMNSRRRLLLSQWSGLIAELRHVYHGPLGYAANFDQVEEVAFWKQLDIMGINAYYQLRRQVMPAAKAHDLYPLLVAGWRRVLTDLQAFRQAQGVAHQPVVFTEMGYTYRRNSTLEPWASDGFSLLPVAEDKASHGGGEVSGKEGGTFGGAVEDGAGKEGGTSERASDRVRRLVVWEDQPVDRQERALAVRALWQVQQELREPQLRGILYWKLSTVPSHRDLEPFVLLLCEGEEDPLLAELQRFVR